MKSRNRTIIKICIAIVMLALGWVLPFLTMQVRELGNMLNLIHIPTFICGMILGPFYGGLIGLITPLTRSLIFGAPKLYPLAICMSLEMAVYGLVIGYLFNKVFNKTSINKILAIILSFIISLIIGRIIWGVSRAIFGMFGADSMTLSIFITSGFVTSIPGTLLQLILLPAIYLALDKTNILNRINKG